MVEVFQGLWFARAGAGDRNPGAGGVGGQKRIARYKVCQRKAIVADANDAATAVLLSLYLLTICRDALTIDN